MPHFDDMDLTKINQYQVIVSLQEIEMVFAKSEKEVELIIQDTMPNARIESIRMI